MFVVTAARNRRWRRSCARLPDRISRTCPMQPNASGKTVGPPCPADEVDDVVPMSSLDARSSGFSWQEGTREFYTSHR
jgi:hypothetical protein